MKKIVLRAVALIFCLFVTVNSPAQEIYHEGNVRVVLEDGWKIYHGDIQVAHGEGTLDMDNLPPAFKAIIDNYATSPVPKTTFRAPKAAQTYGPYITVNWNQGAPYNQAFPTVNGEPTLVGCSTIATAQVINFFRHCNKLQLSGRNQAYSDLQSPFFFDYEKNMDGTFYSYTYNYTPDFDKINADTAELSKFLFAIALAQHAYFDLDGTMTSIYTQRGALDNVFGYDYDLYEGNSIQSAIQQAIISGVPVILNGNNSAAGHSFNVDGYNGSEFHFNYGWGGYCDGWFLMTQNLFPEHMTAVVVHPSDGSRVKMQPIPASVRIYSTDPGNNYDQTIDMTPAWENATSYTPKNLVDLEPGNYAFYFIYPDGTTIAPYLEDNTPLSKLHEDVISYGKYITSPAQFSVGYQCKVNFWHSPEMGYIEVLAQDFKDPDFENLGVSFMMNDVKTPMTYDSDLNQYAIEYTWEPGEYEFLYYIAKYDTTIGKAERCGPAPTNVYYGINDNTNTTGWSATYTDTPVNIILADYAVVEEQQIPVLSVTVQIVLDQYCDARLNVLSYTIDQAGIKKIKADANAPAYILNNHILIRNGKKIMIK